MKAHDKDYFGCSDRVFTASPVLDSDKLSLYYYYMTERHKIYKKKERGESKPWTDDPILQKNSFTCCKRYLDKTSKYLINKIILNPELSYKDKIWRTILFRLYNKIETMQAIDISAKDFWSHYRESMDIIDNIEGDPFGRAYKIIMSKYAYRDISPKGHDCWKSSLFYYIYSLYKKYEESTLVISILEESPTACLRWLKDNIVGIGDFISYQIWVDLTYILEYPMSDNYFTIAGPGCRDGIDMLCIDRDGLNYEEFLFWLRDHIETLFREIDNKYSSEVLFSDLLPSSRYWSLQDLENSFCEFSKYNYIKEGLHKRPRKYNGIPTES